MNYDDDNDDDDDDDDDDISYFYFLLQNISGTFTSIISILAQYFAPNPRTSAIYYFITALFVLLACFDTYFALPINVSNTYIIYQNNFIPFDFIIYSNKHSKCQNVYR
jgi:hypothetical protein